MAEGLPQFQDSQPILQAQPVSSKAEGYEAFAKTLGNIAGATAQKATEYAEEASQTNLLEQQSMLSDLENNSKIQMLQNPGMATKIAEKATYTAGTIKETAALNTADRRKFNYLADNTMRDLSFQAAKTSIGLNNESIKYSTLASFTSTSQQIYEKLFTDPKAADILINAQYSSLAGQVRAGILTATEAATLHKQIDEEIKRAQIRGSAYKSGNATPSDVNALASYQPSPTPYSNAGLPMSETMRYQATSYLSHMNAQDVKAAYASGNPVPANALMWIKSDETAMGLQSYKFGAAQANGDIQAGKSWIELKKEAGLLNSKGVRLNNEQEGYRDRLNNHILGIEKGGSYSSYIAGTPDGGKAYLDFNRQNAVIDSANFVGSPESVAAQKNAAHLKNLNTLVSRVNAIGLGMDIPDQFRNPIPAQYTAPIANAFQAGSDPSSAVNMIAAFDDKNRPYLANAMPNPRQRLTVYETGKLLGKADAGFLSDFWHSQQEGAIGSKDTPTKSFFQTDKTGMSDAKIKDSINSHLTDINNFLAKQPGGTQLVPASSDKAVRYIKYMALKNNDPTFSHMDDYIKSYTSNVGRAYQPVSSWSYTIDKNVIPLEKPDMDILAAHALAVTYNKMGQYMTQEEVHESVSRNQPMVISSPTGRITVVDQYGRAIAAKDGHAAFDEMYTEGLLRKSQHDNQATNTLIYNNPFMKRGNRPYEFEIGLGENLIRNKK